MKPIRGKNEGAGDDQSVIGPRRRKRAARSSGGASWKSALEGFGTSAAGRIAVLGSVGLFLGYLVATRVVFPAPPGPTDLVQVPDLKSRSLTDVEAELTRLGLVLAEVDSVKHPVLEDGIIFGQSPLPGQWAMPGAGVRLTLSSGRQEIRIPDLAGSPVEQALGLLKASGFTVQIDSVESSQPRGEVVATNPEAGMPVSVPSDVRLSVSLGPLTVEVPRLIGLSEEEATTALTELGLVVSDVEVRFRFGLDQGKVIEQEPAPGREVEEGSGVRLVVGRRAREGGAR